MKNTNSPSPGSGMQVLLLAGLLGLLLLALLTLPSLQPLFALPSAALATTPAYPAPPERGVTETLPYYPPPGDGKPTGSPQPTVTPRPAWQSPTPYTPTATLPMPPFPQAAVRRVPAGEEVQTGWVLWYPHYPDSGAAPVLVTSLLDEELRTWKAGGKQIDLGLTPRSDSLHGLLLSPDHTYILVEVWSREYSFGYQVDIHSGEVTKLAIEYPYNPLTWLSDDQILLLSGGLILRLGTNETELFNYYKVEERRANLGDALLSNNEQFLAYDISFPTHTDYPDAYSLLVLHDFVTDIDIEFHREDTPCGMAYLQWSNDDSQLLWVTDFCTTGVTENVIRLQAGNIKSGIVRQIDQMGSSMVYQHQPVWAPDGNRIAAVKVEKVEEGGSKDIAGNIVLYDLRNGNKQQLTWFENQRISNLHWTPDGRWILFTLEFTQDLSGRAAGPGDPLEAKYGEIWAVSPDGTQMFAVAGPTTRDAPFILLPLGEGE